jgi:RNA polymerase sigma-32 factor
MNGKKPPKPLVVDVDPGPSLVARRTRSLADSRGEWLESTEGTAADSSVADSRQGADAIYSSFARKVASLKRLSQEEEHELGLRIQKFNDNAAKQKLVLHNMRLALKMAHQYRRSWTNLMDLVQEASAGMAIAAQKWDPTMETSFGTYAAYWIRAQLTKFLMTNGRLIHTGNTRAGRKVYFQLPQIRRKLLLEGKTPTVELIAKEVGEDPQEVSLLLARLSGKETSLSTPIDDENSLILQDTLTNDDKDPEHQAIEKEMQRAIKNVISGFEGSLKDERDIAIWREHLIANDPISLVDLGTRFGVSKQRMGQIATRLKRNFRCYIIDELGPTTSLSWLFHND